MEGSDPASSDGMEDMDGRMRSGMAPSSDGAVVVSGTPVEVTVSSVLCEAAGVSPMLVSAGWAGSSAVGPGGGISSPSSSSPESSSSDSSPSASESDDSGSESASESGSGGGGDDDGGTASWGFATRARTASFPLVVVLVRRNLELTCK